MVDGRLWNKLSSLVSKVLDTLESKDDNRIELKQS